MKSGRSGSILIIGLLLLSACSSTSDVTVQTAPSPTVDAPTNVVGTAPVSQTSSTTAPDSDPTPIAALFDGLALPTDAGSHFSGSGACTTCHSGMVDAAGNNVSIDSTWRSSMMANAARDPYWLATVEAEVAQTPDLTEIIEDKCSTCHMPMARTTDSFAGNPGVMSEDGYLNPTNEQHVLAMDGVSCTVCHQIESANLGTVESYSGGFLIDAEAPRGERTTYGPFEVTDMAIQVMGGATGFAPVQSAHIQESAICATCHTLYTPFVDEDGVVAGIFPEQTPLLELQASDINQSCQDCHMPIVNGEVAVSTVLGEPRTDVNRHYFVGGNEYMLSIMRSFGDEMGLTASSENIQATAGLVVDQLATSTATLSTDVQLEGSQLQAEITISNTAGHKFPTGFPSRRAWLHVTVLDSVGTVVFESGAWTPDGAIVGNDNDIDPDVFEPHYSSITDPGQVQIYETILMTTDNELTTTLLRGAAYAKDNRLLPTGFDKAGAGADIAVHGAAANDASFNGGGDTIDYLIDVDGSSGQLTVEVELLYQSISLRWADNLAGIEGPALTEFAGYYETVPNAPTAVATTSATVGG